MPRKYNGKQQKGFSLVEVILAISILLAIFLSASSFFLTALDVSETTTRHIQSTYLVEEGIEAIRALRDAGWTPYIMPLSTTTAYYLLWTGSQWSPTTTPQKTENIYTRSFVVEDVFRDAATYDIASSGTFDRDTKKFTFTVAWPTTNGTGTSTETAETIIGNLFLN